VAQEAFSGLGKCGKLNYQKAENHFEGFEADGSLGAERERITMQERESWAGLRSTEAYHRHKVHEILELEREQRSSLLSGALPQDWVH
jgi:hypothetical protein